MSERQLRAKVRQLHRLRAQLRETEQQIRAAAATHYKNQGCLVVPRIERVLQEFA